MRRQKRSKKSVILIVLASMSIAGGGYVVYQNRDRDTNTDTQTQPAVSTQQSDTVQPTAQPGSEEQVFNKQQYSLSEASSLWIIANKSHPLSGDYVPPDLRQPAVSKKSGKSSDELSLRAEAAGALERLFTAAGVQGIKLQLRSAYRSYAKQVTYYNGAVAAYGQAQADRVSAKPGSSEHQTGWAADLTGLTGSCDLETCFGESKEGQWLAAHAHEYGFILRYPQDKEAVTGYSYEPWHIRYVGEELARELMGESQTMEEYFAY